MEVSVYKISSMCRYLLLWLTQCINQSFECDPGLLNNKCSFTCSGGKLQMDSVRTDVALLILDVHMKLNAFTW